MFYSMERIAELILPVFPAPLEVDRFLYNELYLNMILMKFPAPFEVNRVFYG